MTPEAEIRLLLRSYFDTIYFGDVAKIREIYHPAAQLFCAADGTFLTLTVDEYVNIVSNRAAPAQIGQVRDDVIEEVAICSPTTARARVRELMLPKRFVDELLFLRVDNRWRIVAKIWHFDLVDDTRPFANTPSGEAAHV